jgi:hypothetical protein
MEKVMLSITKEMLNSLEEERKKRLLDSVPETIRVIISEYFRSEGKTQDIREILKEAVRDYERRRKSK